MKENCSWYLPKLYIEFFTHWVFFLLHTRVGGVIGVEFVWGSTLLLL